MKIFLTIFLLFYSSLLYSDELIVSRVYDNRTIIYSVLIVSNRVNKIIIDDCIGRLELSVIDWNCDGYMVTSRLVYIRELEGSSLYSTIIGTAGVSTNRLQEEWNRVMAERNYYHVLRLRR